MSGMATFGPEDRLFNALGDVFRMEPEQALQTSKEAACLIACFVADIGAVSRTTHSIDAALARIQEMQLELAELSQHLEEFKATRIVHAVH